MNKFIKIDKFTDILDIVEFCNSTNIEFMIGELIKNKLLVNYGIENYNDNTLYINNYCGKYILYHENYIFTLETLNSLKPNDLSNSILEYVLDNYLDLSDKSINSIIKKLSREIENVNALDVIKNNKEITNILMIVSFLIFVFIFTL